MGVKFDTTSNGYPSQTDYFVSAGTVNVTTVDGMASGFTKFKNYFGFNSTDPTTPINQQPAWAQTLQQTLNTFHAPQSKASMPAFQHVVAEKGRVGGIATVPINHGNGTYTHCDRSMVSAQDQTKAAEDQYKAAIQGAIDGARKADKPLFIQPPGIGAYGWEPDDAARLFAEVIDADTKAVQASQNKSEPLKPVDIKIPIYSDKDKQFQQALAARLNPAQVQQAAPPPPTSPLKPAANSKTAKPDTALPPIKKNASAAVKADPQVIQDMKAAYDKIAKNPDDPKGGYKKGYTAPVVQDDGSLKVEFPDPAASKAYFTKLASEGKPFSVSNDKGEVIAYSNGDGKIRGNDHKPLSADDASDWKPAVPGTNFKEFPMKTIEEAKEFDTSLEQAATAASSPK